MPEMIRILCEGLATVLFTLICTRFLCQTMKKRDFRFVPWLPYVLTVCGSAMLFLLGGLSPWTFCGIAFLFVLLYASVQDHSTHEADDILSVMMLMLAVTNISEATVLSQLFGAAIVGGAQMLIALCGKKRMGIGGADIKLSKLLAYLNTTTTLHFSLVCRGDKTVAEQYLKVQEDYLASHSSETTSQEDTNG